MIIKNKKIIDRYNTLKIEFERVLDLNKTDNFINMIKFNKIINSFNTKKDFDLIHMDEGINTIMDFNFYYYLLDTSIIEIFSINDFTLSLYMYLINKYGSYNILYDYWMKKKYYDFHDKDMELIFNKIAFNNRLLKIDDDELKTVFKNITFNGFFYIPINWEVLTVDEIILIKKLNYEIPVVEEEVKKLDKKLDEKFIYLKLHNNTCME